MVAGSGLVRRGLSGVVAIALSLMFAAALVMAGAAEKKADELQVPAWVLTDDWETTDDQKDVRETLPSSFDLRDKGLVTPVKAQDPWGSCWAFGGIAAAESSILSMRGTTAAESGLDLSERHLTYFALHPVTERVDSKQVGEGIHMFDTSRNAEFDAGSDMMAVTTLFSQGSGPVPEEWFPYRGKAGITQLQYMEEHPEESAREELKDKAEAEGLTLEDYLEREKAGGTSEKELIDRTVSDLRESLTKQMAFSEHDDWSIPEVGEDGQPNRLLTDGAVLKDGNVLPAYWNEDGTANDDAMRAMKRELLAGHAICLGYHADISGKFRVSSKDGGTGYAQYVFDKTNAPDDHDVCVVGFDDDYDASNFEHDVYRLADPDQPYDEGNFEKDADGKPIVDKELTAKTRPSRDGAWIVKNSWGSETDAIRDKQGGRWNFGKFGMLDDAGRHTGFFYLSYDDKVIVTAETLAFTEGLGSEEIDDGFETFTYDYMPSIDGELGVDSDTQVLSAANVFENDGGDVVVRSLSTRTYAPDSDVTFAVYLLRKGYASPTDGELVLRTSEDFAYAGFHRLDLDTPIRLKEGQTFSVVTTASSEGDEGGRLFSVVANRGVPESVSRREGYTLYSEAVVNEGESYLYKDGVWQDWQAYLKSVDSYGFVDNFSIKAYSYDDVHPLRHVKGTPATCTTSGTAEYWYDEEHDLIYANEQGTKPIDRADLALVPLGHDWDEGEGAVARTYTCRRCGETKTARGATSEPMPAASHASSRTSGETSLAVTGDGGAPGTVALLACGVTLLACGIAAQRRTQV